jgi:glycosyltransferase involved in cell wall biosynthesis
VRVLVVIEALGEGGTERSIADLLPPLVARGVEPVLATLRSRGEEGVEPELRRAGFDIRVLGAGSWPATASALAGLTESVRPDLIHTMLYRSTIHGRVAGVRHRVPVLTSLVNTVYSSPPATVTANPRKQELARAVDRFTARHVNAAFHAVSDAVRRDAIAGLGVAPDRVVVIPRGRDVSRLGRPSCERRAAARTTLGLEADQPVVVFVGRHEAQKDHPTVLRAAARLVARHPQLALLMVGREGPTTAAVRELSSSLGLDGNVRWLGHRGDVPEVLAAADVFTLATRHEGMPGVVLEAMGLGVPVVATDIPPMREVVEAGGSGILVPPDDDGAFERALDELLLDPAARQRMGARGRAIFEAEYTMDASADRTAALYAAVAARSPLPQFHDGRPAGGRAHGVLVTHERPDVLGRTLERVLAPTQDLASLTVVDNSPHCTAEPVVAKAASVTPSVPVTYLPAGSNTGPAGGFALGARHVLEDAGDDDWVLLLDDDNPPTTGTAVADLLRFAHERSAADGDVAAVGVVGARLDRRRWRITRLADSELHGPVEVDLIANGKLPLVRARALRIAGLPDPSLFFGLEELELGLRLRRHGYRLVVDGERWLDRRSGMGRTGPTPERSRPDSPGRRYLSTRNLVVIARRHGGPVAALRTSVAHAVGRPVVDAARRRTPWWGYTAATWSGVGDAWRGRLGARRDPVIPGRR